MFDKLVIKHKPSASMGKYTIMLNDKIIKISNEVNPHDLLDLLYIPHTYEVEGEVKSAKKN